MKRFAVSALMIIGLGSAVLFSADSVEKSQNEKVEVKETVSTAPKPGETAVIPGVAIQAENAAQSPANSGKGKKYIVQSGDCLSSIAAKFLGSADKYWDIIEKNKEKYPSIVKNPDLIYPGWELEIPGDISTEVPTPEKPQEGTVEVDSALNIRSGPWGEVIGKVHDGDKLKIIGVEGDWYKIEYEGKTAYVHSNYVSTAQKPAGVSQVKDRPGSQPGSDNDDQPVTPGQGRFGAAPCSPMPGRTSSEFGPRDLFGHSFHSGIDLPVPTGTRLNALGDGVVTAAGYEAGGGRFIKIRYDNGFESFYCHLQSTAFPQGTRVSMGQEVARSDNTGQWTTGAHLHMGIKQHGEYINPRRVPGLPLPPK